MITVFAAALIPLVTAGQIVALSLLWRRYRMPGSGWWLVATVLICLGTAAQAIEESGWRPMALTAAVNALCFWGAVTEFLAARVITGTPVPSRGRIVLLGTLGLIWALVAAYQAARHPGQPLLFGLLRAPCNLLITVSETAIAVSLVRLSRSTATAGGLVAAAGYGVMVATLPAYPFSFEHPWIRTAGMVVGALGFVLVGWGLLLLIWERHQADLLRHQTETLALQVTDQAERVVRLEQQVTRQATLLTEQEAQADLGRIAADLAADLLATMDDLRQSAAQFRAETGRSDHDRLAGRIERTLQDLAQTATGVVQAASPIQAVDEPVDCRLLIEGLIADAVPDTVMVMKAWPSARVWVTTDRTLLRLALHEMIQHLIARHVERLSIIVEHPADVTLTMEQSLSRGTPAEPTADTFGLKLAQLAIHRLGGRLYVQPGAAGTRLVLHLPDGQGKLPTPAAGTHPPC
jgi:hypothetical protein